MECPRDRITMPRVDGGYECQICGRFYQDPSEDEYDNTDEDVDPCDTETTGLIWTGSGCVDPPGSEDTIWFEDPD